jgi:hypothetical protein
MGSSWPSGRWTPADREEVLTILAPIRCNVLFALSYILLGPYSHALPGTGNAAAGAMDTTP